MCFVGEGQALGARNISIEIKAMLDQALVGSVVTGVLGLVAQAISKVKCYISCKRDEDNEICEPQCTCGFLDSTLLDMKSPDIKDETHARATPSSAALSGSSDSRDR